MNAYRPVVEQHRERHFNDFRHFPRIRDKKRTGMAVTQKRRYAKVTRWNINRAKRGDNFNGSAVHSYFFLGLAKCGIKWGSVVGFNLSAWKSNL